MNSNDEKLLIEACLRNERQAQFRLYEFFAPRLMPVCRNYSRNSWDVDDILQEGFIKAFRYLDDFRFNGSFEGWLRRIMVTTALNFYKRKRITYTETELNYFPDEVITEMTVIAGLQYDDLMHVVSNLPNGYHQVFRLNAIEGYSHKEIGQMLNISVNTSKSQLMRARDHLQKKIVGSSVPTNNQKDVLQTA
jgi:RNA polymerase sigma factor (sigma-70 family)